MIEPFPIGELSSEAAAWRSAVLGTRRTMRLSLHGTPLVLLFHEAVNTVSSDPLVQISVGNAMFWIGMADWNQLPGLTDFLDGGRVSSIPEDLMPAVLEALLERELDQLGNLCGGRAAIVAFGSSTVAPETCERVGLHLLSDGSPVMQGFLAGDPAAMTLLRSLVEQAAPEAAEHYQHMPLTAGVEIGAVRLTFDELQRLKFHDILMLDTCTWGGEREGWIRFPPACAWKVRIDAGQVCCLVRADDGPMIDRQGDGLAVVVIAEMGSVRCTIEQLSTLQPETNLPILNGEVVALKCGGRPFAQGELVQIGERHGVRLLSSPAPHGPQLTQQPSAREEAALVSL